MKPEPIELTASNGETIRGFFQQPFYLTADIIDPALMIFCHGFPGSDMQSHSNLFEDLQNLCARIGLSSVRFDFRGCGTSDGASEDFTVSTAIEDMQSIYTWAEEHHYERFMLTMEGLGSVPALMTLNDQVEVAAFLWPVFDTKDYAIRNLQAEKYKHDLEKGGVTKIDFFKVGIPLIKELYEMDITPIMNQVIMPTLIQQGAMDERIPIEHLDLARAHFRNRRIELTTYQDGIHGLPKESHRKYLYYHYEQFIQKYI